jgi:O-antigen/teichoic acid export membrane protein
MREHARRLSSDVLIYGLGRALVPLVGFATLPIMTRIFSPRDYGFIETIAAMMGLITIATTLGLESASQRSYFDYGPADRRQRQAVLSTAVWTALGWSVLVTLVVVAHSDHLAIRLFGSTELHVPLVIAAVTIPVTVMTNFCLEILRLQHRPVRYSLLTLLAAIATAVLAVTFAALADWSLQGFYLGTLLGWLLTLAAGGWLVRGAITAVFDWSELRTMLAFGLPLWPVAASSWAMAMADRFFLLEYASADALGLYGLGVRLSNLVLLGVTAVGIAWSPFALELHSRDPEQERLVRAQALTYVTCALAFMAVCVSVYAREFLLLVTPPTFVEGYRVVGILSMGIVALGVNSVTMTGITLARETRYFAQYTVVTAGLNLVLNALLIPSAGIIGAAAATTLSYIVLALLYYHRAQRLDPVPYNGRRVVAIMIVASVLIALGTVISLDPLWLSIVAKAPLILAFLAVAWLVGAFDMRLLEAIPITPMLSLLRGRGL